MKNITLAMVAVLAAVAMLSAGLAIPMQQASASSEVETGDNKVIIKQTNECEDVEDSCTNDIPDGTITQNTGADDFPPGPP